MRLSAQLRRQQILKRLHGESRVETDFRRRHAMENLKLRLSSLALRARDSQEKLQRAWGERLLPSLHELGSLDSLDTGLALSEWIKKRKIETRSASM